MQCTQSCNTGVQFRGVRCVGGDVCKMSERPVDKRDCGSNPCPSTTTVAPSTTLKKIEEVDKGHNDILKWEDPSLSNSIQSTFSNETKYTWLALTWNEVWFAGGSVDNDLFVVTSSVLYHAGKEPKRGRLFVSR